MTLDHYLTTRPDRCTTCGRHPGTQGHARACTPTAPTDEWQLFLAALRAAVREDGTIHQGDVRPAIRGRIEPKRVGTAYRKARTLGLIEQVGMEPSTDVAGRNSDKLSRVYRWVGEAA